MVPARYAFLTPPFPSALSLVRLWADDATLSAHFVRPKSPSHIGVPRLSRLKGVDEGLMAASADGSWLFTPHGGAGVQAGIRQRLSDCGWQEVAPPEFDSDFGAGLNREQQGWLALIPSLPSPAATRLGLACMALSGRPQGVALIVDNRIAIDCWLRRPLVVLRGLPNAGKTSLLNALCRDVDAIVSDVAGTTRDVLEGTWAIGQHWVTLLDTPGIREASHAGESEGIEIGRGYAERADLIIELCGPEAPPATSEPTSLIVHSKCDLQPAPVGGVGVSVSTGVGLSELAAIVEMHLFPALPDELLPD